MKQQNPKPIASLKRAMEPHCRTPTGTKGQQIKRLQLQASQSPGKEWGFKHSWKQHTKISCFSGCIWPLEDSGEIPVRRV